MSAAWIALLAAIATIVCWTAKAVAIGAAGGLGRSTLESPLFVLGTACYVTCCAALGFALSRGATRVRSVWAIGAAVLGITGIVAVEAALFALEPDPHRPWIWDEASLWIVAAASFALAIFAGSPRRISRPDPPRSP